MKLKQLKMTGFKSFVETTKLVFKNNITGVVGPNGCGKSNVIDAVKWVLGENSAKNLRSDGMANVIFGGSSNRKPSGQASVELIFDNSNGRLTGEYHSYSEISVKRVMNSDGNSTYYLNSTRCRRKDITDVFLGTGLGARSYSIIEQGVISKFVEAKPEDLRIYIEEAAGISKYKERRKETNNKINATQENLNRINDLKDELGRQLEKIKKQANTAEKYKLLKKEEHELRLKLLSLKWDLINSSIESVEKKFDENSLELESSKCSKENIDKELTNYREQAQELQNEQFTIQEDHYEVNSQIAKKEQALKYNEERKSQISKDLEFIQKEISGYQNEIEQDNKQLSVLKNDLEEVQSNDNILNSFEESKKLYQSMDEKKQLLEEKLSEITKKIIELEKTIVIEEERINQFNSRKQIIDEQKNKLTSELRSIDLEGGVKDKELLSINLSDIEKAFTESKLNLEKTQQSLVNYEHEQDEILKLEKEFSNKLQDLSIALATLEAEQKTDGNNCSEDIDNWLQESGYSQKPLLRETIKVKPGWEKALEVVLSDKLQAICLNDLTDSIEYLETFRGSLTIVGELNGSVDNRNTNLTPLYTKIVDPDSTVKGLLKNVYVIEGIHLARDILPTINGDESLVTRDGIWIHKNYIKIIRPSDNNNSILIRQQHIDEKKNSINEFQQKIEKLLIERQDISSKIKEAKRMVELHNVEKDRIYKERVSLESRLQSKKIEIDNLNKKQEQIKLSLSDLEERLGSLANDIDNTNRNLFQTQETLNPLLDLKKSLEDEKYEFEEKFLQAKHESEEASELQYKHNLKEQTLTAELKSFERNISRLNELLSKSVNKKLSIEKELNSDDINSTLEEELEKCLNDKIYVEDKLHKVQTNIAKISEVITDFESKRTEIDYKVNEFNELSHKFSLELEGYRVKRASIEEQLVELDISISDFKQYPIDGLIENELASELQNIVKKIERLGPINLTAIDEYASEKERHDYYEQQSNDLDEALKILLDAIRKIDLETKNRFKTTYSAINDNFRDLFPKLFGGGKAELYLTDKNLLETGVGVIAKPPGKKVSNISALSGGEKAMTAVALVFSIFKLNPAPFCLLDEVDAPLDDANVLRFCEVIKDMSKSVQFIVITHNKLTMEMTDQLSGVTMQEPGVSRLVSVDIEEVIDAA